MRRYRETRNTLEEAYALLVNNYNQFVSNVTDPSGLEIKSIQEMKSTVRDICGEEINSPEELRKRAPFQRVLDYKIREKTKIHFGKLRFFTFQYEILEEQQDYASKNYSLEQIICYDSHKQKNIVAKVKRKIEIYNTEELFNDFIKLNIGKPERLYYPNDSDRDKIIKFVEKYGIDFIEYPHKDRSGKEWKSSWTYFDEFNYQFQSFMHCYKKIAKKRLLLYDEALSILNANLGMIKYQMAFFPFEKFKGRKEIGMNIFKPEVEYKILYCYDKLRKILESKQPAKECKHCKNPFFPSRMNSDYCSDTCRNRAKQARFHAKKRLGQ